MNEIIDGEIVTDADAVDTDLAPATAAATPASVIEPRVGIRIREGTLADVAFIDRMQKAQSRELGFLPLMAIEGKVKLNQVLIAESDVGATPASPAEGRSTVAGDAGVAPTGMPVGYLIAADRYCRRDEIGYVTQINVLPEYRRHLVAAKLLSAQFDRSAYGCRLYGCWCAQDLKANEFWEAMGFTAIAFRTGSRTKGRDASGKAMPRVHLFWQKRIRPNDTTTPWWYPAKTEGGEMREDRLVFPIPAGVQWQDVLPIVLPETANAAMNAAVNKKALGATVYGTPQAVLATDPTALSTRPSHPEKKKPKTSKEPAQPAAGLWFGGSRASTESTDDDRASRAEARAIAKAAAKAAAARVDPRLITLSRELRDRWTETAEFLLSSPGKYNLCRTVERPLRRSALAAESSPTALPALPAAA